MTPRSWTLISLAGCTVLVLGACAAEAPPIPFDTVPPETSPQIEQTLPTIPVTSTAAVASSAIAGPSDAVGESWQNATSDLVGLRSECGNVTYVSGRPDRRELITGVALNGLWSSSDGGDSWAALGQGEGSEVITNRLTSVVYDPEVPERYWVTGLYNGYGAYRTDDNGSTFRHLGDVFGVDSLSIDFGDPERQTMIAALHESMDIMLSTDGGATWVGISDGLPEEGGQLSAAMLIDPATFIAGVWNGPVPGVYRTTDTGATWHRVHPDPVIGMPFRAQDGNLYWLVERGGGVITSSDNGATWTRQDGRGISPFAVNLVELPDGRFAALGGTNVVVSADHGASWREIGPGLPYNANGINYSPGDEAFYIWRYSCDLTGENPVVDETIMRLAFGPLAEGASDSVVTTTAATPDSVASTVAAPPASVATTAVAAPAST